MGIIIGGGTTVSFGSSCAVSAQWGMSANRQDVYCLGSFLPNSQYSILKPQTTVNITVYSPGPTYSTPGSSSCTSASTLSATITPVGCGSSGGGSGVSGSFWVVGYSYSKQSKDVPGQESWSMVRYEPTSGGVSPTVLRGTATGQGTSGSGVRFTGVTTAGSAGSVSANSLGTSDSVTAGTVSSVGGGASGSSDSGTGNASIPYNVLYI